MSDLINDFKSQGKAVIMISSEMPEILGLSDRILIPAAIIAFTDVCLKTLNIFLVVKNDGLNIDTTTTNKANAIIYRW